MGMIKKEGGSHGYIYSNFAYSTCFPLPSTKPDDPSFSYKYKLTLKVVTLTQIDRGEEPLPQVDCTFILILIIHFFCKITRLRA